MAKPPVGAPYAPAKYEPADIGAIQALAQGDARSDQQQRALRWIVEEACKAYDLSYRSNSDRDTAFAEGKRFVGLQIVKLTKLNLGALRKTDGRSPPSDRDPDRGPAPERPASE